MLGFEVVGLVSVSSCNDMLEVNGGISEPEMGEMRCFLSDDGD